MKLVCGLAGRWRGDARIAPSITAPIVGTDASVLRERDLNLAPLKRPHSDAGIDDDGWIPATLAVQVEAVSTYINAASRRRQSIRIEVGRHCLINRTKAHHRN